MKELEKTQPKEPSKEFPLLKIIVFSIWGLLIYAIYYLTKYGV
jgi:hypothetical protein